MRSLARRLLYWRYKLGSWLLFGMTYQRIDQHEKYVVIIHPSMNARLVGKALGQTFPHDTPIIRAEDRQVRIVLRDVPS